LKILSVASRRRHSDNFNQAPLRPLETEAMNAKKRLSISS